MQEVTVTQEIMNARAARLYGLQFGEAQAWTATIVSTRNGPITTIMRAIIEIKGPLSTGDPCDTYAIPDTTAQISLKTKVIHAATIPSVLACAVNVNSDGMLVCLIFVSPLSSRTRSDPKPVSFLLPRSVRSPVLSSLPNTTLSIGGRGQRTLCSAFFL